MNFTFYGFLCHYLGLFCKINDPTTCFEPPDTKILESNENGNIVVVRCLDPTENIYLEQKFVVLHKNPDKDNGPKFYLKKDDSDNKYCLKFRDIRCTYTTYENKLNEQLGNIQSGVTPDVTSSATEKNDQYHDKPPEKSDQYHDKPPEKSDQYYDTHSPNDQPRTETPSWNYDEIPKIPPHILKLNHKHLYDTFIEIQEKSKEEGKPPLGPGLSTNQYIKHPMIDYNGQTRTLDVILTQYNGLKVLAAKPVTIGVKDTRQVVNSIETDDYDVYRQDGVKHKENGQHNQYQTGRDGLNANHHTQGHDDPMNDMRQSPPSSTSYSSEEHKSELHNEEGSFSMKGLKSGETGETDNTYRTYDNITDENGNPDMRKFKKTVYSDRIVYETRPDGQDHGSMYIFEKHSEDHEETHHSNRHHHRTGDRSNMPHRGSSSHGHHNSNRNHRTGDRSNMPHRGSSSHGHQNSNRHHN